MVYRSLSRGTNPDREIAKLRRRIGKLEKTAKSQAKLEKTVKSLAERIQRMEGPQ